MASASGSTRLKPDLAKAVKAKLPAALEPQLATLTSAAPDGPGWVVETKLDGYRMLARVEHGVARLFTRRGHDWTDRMKSLALAVENLGISNGWLDGEIVVMNSHGLPDFNALQNAIGNRRNESIVYFTFDAPFYGGLDLRKVPLWSRRAILQEMLQDRDDERIRFSGSFDVHPLQVLEAARQMGMEGVMLKRLDAPYVSGRSDSWLKLKCTLSQEFVICGFTSRTGSQREVGGLLLGYYQDGVLCYAGSVGTGWGAKVGQALHEELSGLETGQPPLDPRTVTPGRWSRRTPGSERWVKPVLVAEVAFSEWTPDGQVRHPKFKAIRRDTVAEVIGRIPPDRSPA
jgi:bifunctional non-homologous end joining protein LigD